THTLPPTTPEIPHLTLADRIEDVPDPLPLTDHITDASSEEELDAALRATELPRGYELYNPNLLNHSKYVSTLHLRPEEDVYPRAVHFQHDYVQHSHYVIGTHPDSIPTNTPYRWMLKATPHPEPSIEGVDETDHSVFRNNHPDYDHVDIGLYGLDDHGLVADVDHHRGLVKEEKDLDERQKVLNKDRRIWRERMGPVHARLTQAKARTRLHPY